MSTMSLPVSVEEDDDAVVGVFVSHAKSIKSAERGREGEEDLLTR